MQREEKQHDTWPGERRPAGVTAPCIIGHAQLTGPVPTVIWIAEKWYTRVKDIVRRDAFRRRRRTIQAG
jgi:hypothetical protein